MTNHKYTVLTDFSQDLNFLCGWNIEALHLPAACFFLFFFQPPLTLSSRFLKFWTSPKISLFISLSHFLSFLSSSSRAPTLLPVLRLSPRILSIIAAFHSSSNLPLYCVSLALSHLPSIPSIYSPAAAFPFSLFYGSPTLSCFFSPLCLWICSPLSPFIAPSLAVCSSMKLKRSKLLFNQSLFGKVLGWQKLSIPSAVSMYACLYCYWVCANARISIQFIGEGRKMYASELLSVFLHMCGVLCMCR